MDVNGFLHVFFFFSFELFAPQKNINLIYLHNFLKILLFLVFDDNQATVKCFKYLMLQLLYSYRYIIVIDFLICLTWSIMLS